MTPDTIEVGQRYYRPSVPQDVFLGVGKRVMWEGTYGNKDSNFHFKHLVLIESDDADQIGLIAQEGDDACDGFWDALIIDTRSNNH